MSNSKPSSASSSARADRSSPPRPLLLPVVFAPAATSAVGETAAGTGAAAPDGGEGEDAATSDGELDPLADFSEAAVAAGDGPSAAAAAAAAAAGVGAEEGTGGGVDDDDGDSRWSKSMAARASMRFCASVPPPLLVAAALEADAGEGAPTAPVDTAG